MRAQDAYNLSVSNSKVELDNVLKSIRKAAEAGKFEYLEYTANCSDTTVKSLRELGYRIVQGASLVKIIWDSWSVSQSQVEKD